jgi:hypothetical protein
MTYILRLKEEIELFFNRIPINMGQYKLNLGDHLYKYLKMMLVMLLCMSVYPHQASLKNMPACPRWESNLRDYIDIEGTRFCSEIPHTRTDLTS